jgi:hypothetical protein
MWHTAGNGHAPRAAASFGHPARAPRGRWVAALAAVALLAGLLSTALATGRLFERTTGTAPMLHWTKPLSPGAAASGGKAASPLAAAAEAAAAIAATAGEALPRDASVGTGGGEEMSFADEGDEEEEEPWEDELAPEQLSPVLPAATAATAAAATPAAGEAVVPIAAATAGSADDAAAEALTAAANSDGDAAAPSVPAPTGADAPSPPATSAFAAAAGPLAGPSPPEAQNECSCAACS